MSGGNNRSYTYKYIELLLPPGIKRKGESYSEK